MSLHRFFLDNQVLADEGERTFALRLTASDLNHARVLRLQPGEHIAVLDAANDYFECEVVSFDDDVRVRITRHEHARTAGATVMLLQGLCKSDKFDEVVRHASEVGVAAFVPLSCERSVVKLDKRKALARADRWRSIAKSAAMQAGLDRIPEVADVTSVADACALISNATCVLVCWEEARALSVGEALRRALAATLTPAVDARVAVVIGPEGGLAEHEVEQLLASNPHAYAVSLGPTILRTETAGVVAPALALYELGGLQ